jgi:hypothetical protein
MANNINIDRMSPPQPLLPEQTQQKQLEAWLLSLLLRSTGNDVVCVEDSPRTTVLRLHAIVSSMAPQECLSDPAFIRTLNNVTSVLLGGGGGNDNI